MKVEAKVVFVKNYKNCEATRRVSLKEIRNYDYPKNLTISSNNSSTFEQD